MTVGMLVGRDFDLLAVGCSVGAENVMVVGSITIVVGSQSRELVNVAVGRRLVTGARDVVGSDVVMAVVVGVDTGSVGGATDEVVTVAVPLSVEVVIMADVNGKVVVGGTGDVILVTGISVGIVVGGPVVTGGAMLVELPLGILGSSVLVVTGTPVGDSVGISVGNEVGGVVGISVSVVVTLAVATGGISTLMLGERIPVPRIVEGNKGGSMPVGSGVSSSSDVVVELGLLGVDSGVVGSGAADSVVGADVDTGEVVVLGSGRIKVRIGSKIPPGFVVVSSMAVVVMGSDSTGVVVTGTVEFPTAVLGLVVALVSKSVGLVSGTMMPVGAITIGSSVDVGGFLDLGDVLILGRPLPLPGVGVTMTVKCFTMVVTLGFLVVVVVVALSVSSPMISEMRSSNRPLLDVDELSGVFSGTGKVSALVIVVLKYWRLTLCG